MLPKRLGALAALMDTAPYELEADLQRYYGIDLERAQLGEHSPSHIAALVAALPQGSRTLAQSDPDAEWTEELCLLADIRNMLTALLWSLGGKGQKPQPIGPSWMTGKRKLDTSAMDVEELNRRLSAKRRRTRKR